MPQVRKVVALIHCAVSVLVAGCATNDPAKALQSALAAVPSCCASPREFPFEPVAIDQRHAIRIDQRSPAYSFPDGKSFFRPIALPASPQPATATIVSFALVDKAGLNERVGYYFLPIVLFYDAGFDPSPPFKSVTKFLFDGRGRRFSAFQVPVPRDARYLAIFTDARILNVAIPIPVEFTTMATHTMTCESATRAAPASMDRTLIEALCGLFNGAPVYVPPSNGQRYASIPNGAGGDLELWLSGPAAERR